MTSTHIPTAEIDASFSASLNRALEQAGVSIEADCPRGRLREWWAVDQGYLSEADLQGLYGQVYGFECLVSQGRSSRGRT